MGEGESYRWVEGEVMGGWRVREELTCGVGG